MKVKAENFTIQMTTNEAYMLCLVLKDVNWKEFSSDAQVVNIYKSFVGEFIEIVSKEIKVISFL